MHSSRHSPSEQYGASVGNSVEQALECDAAIVATTAETHFSVAASLIEAGLPLLIEKPLTLALDDARALVVLAERSSVPIMCGFVERFNPVITAAHQHLSMEGPAVHLRRRRDPGASSG